MRESRRIAYTICMRLLLIMGLVLGCLVGCKTSQQDGNDSLPEKPVGRKTKIGEVTADNSLRGKVAYVNLAARTVVLSFAVGRVPALDQMMYVYRNGVRIGQVKVTGPRTEYNIAGDIIQGEAQEDDEVREGR